MSCSAELLGGGDPVYHDEAFEFEFALDLLLNGLEKLR